MHSAHTWTHIRTQRVAGGCSCCCWHLRHVLHFENAPFSAAFRVRKRKCAASCWRALERATLYFIQPARPDHPATRYPATHSLTVVKSRKSFGFWLPLLHPICTLAFADILMCCQLHILSHIFETHWLGTFDFLTVTVFGSGHALIVQLLLIVMQRL